MMAEVDQLHQDMLDQVDDSYQKTIGFPTWDILRAVAVALAPFTDTLAAISEKLDVENLSGEELRRFIKQRSGITFKEATQAAAVLTVTGNGIVPKGMLFESAGGVQFTADAEIVIDGVGQVPVTALLAGTAGNVGAGSITMIPKTVQGITACNNQQPASGGYAEEQDESLRERYYEFLQTPATSGNISHYKQWAKKVPGVGDAKVFPLWKGANTVQIVIINDQMQPAATTLVKAVQDYIDPNSAGTGEGEAPIGAYCTVASAQPLQINISVTLIYSTGYTTADIRGKITEYLKSIAFKQNYVSVGRIGDTILDTVGVADYADLRINSGVQNITVPEKSVAVLGLVTANE